MLRSREGRPRRDDAAIGSWIASLRSQRQFFGGGVASRLFPCCWSGTRTFNPTRFMERSVKRATAKWRYGCGMKRRSRVVAHGCAVSRFATAHRYAMLCLRGAATRLARSSATGRRKARRASEPLAGERRHCLSTWTCELAPACGCREAQGRSGSGEALPRPAEPAPTDGRSGPASWSRMRNDDGGTAGATPARVRRGVFGYFLRHKK